MVVDIVVHKESLYRGFVKGNVWEGLMLEKSGNGCVAYADEK